LKYAVLSISFGHITSTWLSSDPDSGHVRPTLGTCT